MPRTVSVAILLTAGLLTGLAYPAISADQTVYQMADGVVRPSRFRGAKEAYLPIIAPTSHASNLLALPNGDLLCVWYTGTGERDRGVSIAMSRLDSGSSRWTLPIIISNHPGWANQNPVLFSAPDGRLWLFHDSQKHGSSEATAIVDELTSDDHGRTWTAPRPLFTQHGFYLRQPLVVFHQKWLFPIYQEESGGVSSAAARNDYSIVEISQGSGKAWSGCTVPGSGGIVQMNIIKPFGGPLLAFFRSRFADWIYESKSEDGCSWTIPIRTSLPNNNASIQAVRLNDGHIVMAFNNAQASTMRGRPGAASREVLSVALSIDNGKTWPWVRDVQAGNEPPPFRPCEDPEYSYPSVVQSPDGMIELTFTFRRETIKYMTFDEQWIKRGATVGVQRGDEAIY
ncbi:MAG TPA: sialidase family protein [Terriglobia bacterium]|nr:sialidase family protein [Terriglobia bacterium]